MKTNILSKAFIFAAGAAVGSVVTWKLLENKYTQRLNQEIEEIERYYGERHESDDPQTEEDVDDTQITKEEVVVYNTIVANYTGEKGGSETMNVGTPPYVISPEEFDMEEDYDTESLTYYTDDILADDNDDIIEDVENVVGTDFKNRFGEFEDDTVFVRNERLRTDYEICRDYRPYSNVVGTNTSPTDDE